VLLSIVECGSHKQFDSSYSVDSVTVSRISNEIEVIGPVLGPSVSHMRNWGAKKAAGEWIFFKDQDCELNTKNLMELIQRIQKNKTSYVAVSGTYRNIAKGLWAQSYGRIQRRWVHRGLQEGYGLRPGDHLLGGVLLVQKKAFIKVGGFNEHIGWGSEELDLVNRLQSLGYKTAVSFNLKTNHNNPLQLSGFLKRAWRQNFNRAYYQLAEEQQRSQPKGLKRNYFKNSSPTILSTGLFFATALMAEKGAKILRRFEGKIN